MQLCIPLSFKQTSAGCDLPSVKPRLRTRRPNGTPLRNRHMQSVAVAIKSSAYGTGHGVAVYKPFTSSSVGPI